MVDTFGESILLIKADDDDLKAGLKRAESAVVTSNAKMNKSFTGLKSTTAALGAVGSRTASAMGTVGAAAGVIGGQAGAAIGPVAGLAGAIGGLAAPILGIAAAAAALGAILVAAFKPSIITNWLSGVTEANKQLKEGEARLKAQRDEITKLVRLQERRLQIAKGLAVASDFIGNSAVRAATKAAEAVELAKAHKVSTDAIASATAARVKAREEAREKARRRTAAATATRVKAREEAREKARAAQEKKRTERTKRREERISKRSGRRGRKLASNVQ